MKALKLSFSLVRVLGLMTLLLPLFSGDLRAQTALPDEQDSAALQCLTKSVPELKLSDEELRANRGPHPTFLRVRLTFEQPGEPPKIEELANTTGQVVHEKAFAYLAGYRLPCLGKRPISAIQEFVFDPLAGADGKPLRLPALAREPDRICLVMPADGPEWPNSRDLVNKVLITARFDGDAQAPPKVKIVYSDATAGVTNAVLDNLADYRMPCRKAGDPPYAFEQKFVFAHYNAVPAHFENERVSLVQLLSSFRGIQNERVFFDLGTMACPFLLSWTSMQPVAANEVNELSEKNANRTEFLAWLAGHQMNMSVDRSKQLLGEDVVIDVPCGVIDLKPEASAAPAAQ